MSERKVLKALFFVACSLVVAQAWYYLMDKPRVWVDEGLNIEIAHNIAEYGIANVFTAPNESPSRPYVIATTGFPVLYPLAGIFKVWGFSGEIARWYMVAWMLIFLASAYYIMGEIYGERVAVFGTLFVATFATFYDIGRTVVGELPGFVWLLWGMYTLFYKRWYGLAGMCIGLAVVSKPSLFLSLVVVSACYLIAMRREMSIMSWARFGVGMGMPLVIWVYGFFPHPFSLTTWEEAAYFLQNPFDTPIVSNIVRNVPVLLHASTILYLACIAIYEIAVFAYMRERTTQTQRRMIGFLLLYAAFGFGYFMRSPGWLRYLFGTELALLLILPFALELGMHKIREWITVSKKSTNVLVYAALLFVVVFQGTHFIVASSIIRSPAAGELSLYLGEHMRAGDKVGIINQTWVASFIPAEDRYHYFYLTGAGVFGTHPLTLPKEKLPQFITYSYKDAKTMIVPYQQTIDMYYTEVYVSHHRYAVLEKKSL